LTQYFFWYGSHVLLAAEQLLHGHDRHVHHDCALALAKPLKLNNNTKMVNNLAFWFNHFNLRLISAKREYLVKE
jgi:hypothetical protein